jgi:hypothetical protein
MCSTKIAEQGYEYDTINKERAKKEQVMEKPSQRCITASRSRSGNDSGNVVLVFNTGSVAPAQKWVPLTGAHEIYKVTEIPLQLDCTLVSSGLYKRYRNGLF